MLVAQPDEAAGPNDGDVDEAEGVIHVPAHPDDRGEVVEYRRVRAEEALDRALVADVAARVIQAGMSPCLPQIVGVLQRHDVQGVHRVAVGEQPVDEMTTDHPGGAGHHYSAGIDHRPTPRYCSP